MSRSQATISIRPGRMSDLERLCALEAASFTGDRLSRARLKHWLGADNGSLLVAVERGHVLGYGLVIFRRDSSAGRIYSIAVDPATRGRGVATALMAALEAAAGSRGGLEVRLEVASRNAPAISLYRRCGYEEFGRRRGYYENGDTAVRMRKALAAG